LWGNSEINIIIIIIVSHLMPSVPLWFHARICRVFPKIFADLVDNGKSGMEFLTGEEHGFPTSSVILSIFHGWLCM
jgi:hypothetical protein